MEENRLHSTPQTALDLRNGHGTASPVHILTVNILEGSLRNPKGLQPSDPRHGSISHDQHSFVKEKKARSLDFDEAASSVTASDPLPSVWLVFIAKNLIGNRCGHVI